MRLIKFNLGGIMETVIVRQPKANVAGQLMSIAAEECAEVIQAASKITRFGLDNYAPKAPIETNAHHMMVEYYQLAAVVEMLQKQGVLPVFTDKYIKQVKQEKQSKVEHYLGVSQQEGCIAPD